MYYNIRDFHALTKTIQIVNKNDTIISVNNTAKMYPGDTVLIDYTFCNWHKYMETNIILSVDDTNTLTLMSPVKIRHPCCVMVAGVDKMRRKPLLLAQRSLFSSESIQIETQTDVEINHMSTQTQCLDDGSVTSCVHDESCSSDHECSEHPSSDCDESSQCITSCDDDIHITIHKTKYDHDHVGLFSNNFLKLT